MFIASGPSGRAWAVGHVGEAARFDGATWSASPTGTKVNLESAAVLADGGVWAAGAAGVVHYDGSAWSVPSEPGMPSGGDHVAVTDDGTVYVSTSDGVLYRRSP